MSKKPMQKFMDWLQYKVTPAVQKFKIGRAHV